jgi:hypothetical protein
MTNPDMNDPAQVKAFLETLEFSLRVDGWTWPLKPLRELAARLTETKVSWRDR